ncbi:MAG: DUF3368 domain-containing protein [Archaeoglobaceae archaeon]
MTFFFDATPLIYLAKVNKLHLLEKIDTELIIPQSVFEEVVVKGRELGKPDALIIERLVDKGDFKIEETDAGESEFYNKLRENENLSQADVEALFLARKRNCTAIMDEDYARRIAEAEGIHCRGTIYLIFSLLKRDVIGKEEARETVDKMIESGWYCSTDLYAKILRRIGYKGGG